MVRFDVSGMAEPRVTTNSEKMITHSIKWLRWPLLAALLVLATMVILLYLSAVDDTPNAQDQEAIHKVFGNLDCSDIESFDEQVQCIQSLQSQLKARIPNMRCADRRVNVEPADFLARKFGCCFDRARMLEKTLTLMGYKVRRVALFDSGTHGYLALTKPGVSSHATLEVLTAKGWMGVDSNELFVLIDMQGNPLTYADIVDKSKNLQQQPAPNEFYTRRLINVYGLYSRHGLSHGPMIPVPEINWNQFFLYNF